MKTNFQSVDEYIASQPEGVRRILEQVRSVIRKALPQAVEAISYQMPTYKLPAGPVLYFAGWKQHYSFVPGVREYRRGIAGRARAVRDQQGNDPLPARSARP